MLPTLGNIFVLKLLISFVVGGGIIAGLGWLAENADRKIAGVIISLPSTVVISYIFIGWTTSPNAVAAAAPSTVMAAAAVQLFTVAYYELSRLRIPHKLASMVLSIAGALLVWFMVAVPTALYEVSSWWIAIIGYGIGVAISYFFVTVKNTSEAPLERIHYTNTQHFGRAVFAGFIIALTVLLANIFSPFWGGVFSSFPAVFTSTFLIMHWYHGHGMIEKITKKIPAGSVIYVVFGVAASFTYPVLGVILGTLAAYATCMVFFFILQWQQRSVK